VGHTCAVCLSDGPWGQLHIQITVTANWLTSCTDACAVTPPLLLSCRLLVGRTALSQQELAALQQQYVRALRVSFCKVRRQQHCRAVPLPCLKHVQACDNCLLPVMTVCRTTMTVLGSFNSICRSVNMPYVLLLVPVNVCSSIARKIGVPLLRQRLPATLLS
jgi:hypothetical protein